MLFFEGERDTLKADQDKPVGLAIPSAFSIVAELFYMNLRTVAPFLLASTSYSTGIRFIRSAVEDLSTAPLVPKFSLPPKQIIR